MYREIARKLIAREPIVLDGGTGTEIQRHGVDMDSEVWCATANLSHPDVVRQVHMDYIRAGAEVITANTYASSPLSFLHLGREAEIPEIDRAAVRLAREAVERAAASPVAIAGSCSVMPPVTQGTDRTTYRRWDPARVKPLYDRKVDELAEAGCDLIIMEMMRDLEISLWATEAALATGLPVWVGMSVEADESGRLVSFSNHKWPFGELGRHLMLTGADVALVMHNEVATTDEALDIIKSEWDGPFGAYPEAGHFEMPTWVFRDLSPDEFATACLRWVEAGATVVGGCCGITPAHISELADRLAAH